MPMEARYGQRIAPVDRRDRAVLGADAPIRPGPAQNLTETTFTSVIFLSGCTIVRNSRRSRPGTPFKTCQLGNERNVVPEAMKADFRPLVTNIVDVLACPSMTIDRRHGQPHSHARSNARHAGHPLIFRSTPAPVSAHGAGTKLFGLAHDTLDHIVDCGYLHTRL